MSDLSELAALAAAAGSAAEAALADPALYASLIDQLPQGLTLVGADGRLHLANQRFRDLWRLPDSACRPGILLDDLLAACPGVRLLSLENLPDTGPSLLPRQRREWQQHDGRIIAVTFSCLPGGAQLGLHEDVTEQRHASQLAALRAPKDTLTGLPDRSMLGAALDAALARNQPGQEVALLCVNLDRFKAINELLGHAGGDALLVQVAERLRRTTRDADAVLHLGADEFAVLQAGTAQPAGSTALARRLMSALNKPYEVGDKPLHMAACIGIAVAPFDADDSPTLLQCADTALGQAKGVGAGTMRYFEPGMDQRKRLRHQTEQDLRSALANHQFELAYQAQVAVGDGTAAGEHGLVGVEALLRWNHPLRGRVSPAEFVPLAEDTGLIVPIGRWVLQQACVAATAWPAHVHIAVNVSPVQFKSPNLLQDVQQALQTSGLPPHRLELKVTEAVLLDDTPLTLSVLHALHDLGVHISLDDFGTGYSSLSYLRRFPFDRLKIDRSFVVDAANGGDGLAIVQAVCSLGRSLRMATTAEGVETDEQLRAVAAAGCNDVQGYLFSLPGPAEAITQLMTSGVKPRFSGGPA